MKTLTIFASEARTAASTDSLEFSAEGYLGARFFLNITAASGTSPTLDVKLQVKDQLSGTWFDVTGAAFAQATSTADQLLTVFPGITTAANVAVSNVIGGVFRLVAAIGGTDTPTFTFSVSAELLGQ